MADGGGYDFGAAFARIEDEIIDSMMRNLKRYHLDWEEAEGFDWVQWQVEQLRGLEEFRAANIEIMGPRLANINEKIAEALQHGYDNGQKEEELRILEALAKNPRLARRLGGENIGSAFFRPNEDKLKALLTATQSDMERAEWAVLRRADDQYRRIIFSAQMYANTGAGTVQKAIDMATKDFLSRGIDCIEYKNGARHTIADYADMAVRTAERRAYNYGEGQARQERGLTLVYVNKRGGRPCGQCGGWIGKILIDDVYSGGKPDGKHTLLSEAMEQGFLHPRCKCGMSTYFPGISPVPDPATQAELRTAEAAEAVEARQRHAENMAEKWERRAKYSLDPADKRQAEARAEEWRRRQMGLPHVFDDTPSEIVNWPKAGRKITTEEFKSVREYAQTKGITLRGVKGSDMDLDLVRNAVDKTSEIVNKYGIQDRMAEPFTLDFSHTLDSADFAVTYPGTKHLIYFNRDAFRSAEALVEAYLAGGRFVPGTTCRSIPYHEMGHIIADIFDIDPLPIAKKISGKTTAKEVSEYVMEHLSIYAGARLDGSEIISECYSAVFSGVQNDFALRFVSECDKIIATRR